ncbi:MAG: hypothetical protein M1839_007866 [Geoglossum umbratile]|nr:MAG: hypothetical protein M1839_007866 [Geoglossum umbratile]
MSRDVNKLLRSQHNHEHQATLDWLTPTDYTPQQSDYIRRRQQGTGQWLLDSEQYQAWLKTPKQTLFCPGIPGAGKTIMTAIVVDDLCTRYQDHTDIGIAYIYCNFRSQQKLEDLLASLLKQLSQKQPSIPKSIQDFHRHRSHKSAQPSLDQISTALHSITAMYSTVFLIVDALDECRDDDRCRTGFLSAIFDLQSRTGVNLFATSRSVPEITEMFKESVLLEILATEEDVRKHLDHHLSSPRRALLRKSPKLQEIKIGIVQAVKGMFLLAQLHLDSLMGKTTEYDIRIALNRLPIGSEAYDHAYNAAMDRIVKQDAEGRKLAKRVLLWISCARRHLTTAELQHALAVEVGNPKYNKAREPHVEDMVSVCAGLVTINEESNIIRLVHYTTQEYFERTWTSWFPDAQVDITRVCVTYLLFDTFESGFCQTDEEFKTRLWLNPLYEYAARNWGYHACAASEAEDQSVPKNMTGVHLAAYFGLKEVIIALLKDGYDLKFKDSHGWTPLSRAAGKGHERVVELLLEKGVDLDSKVQYGWTPLSLAAASGHDAVVKLLLERSVDPNSKDNIGWTPLLMAAAKGHETVVKLLLEKGADPNSKDKEGQTPLLQAAERGHEMVVKLLLERGSDPNSENNSGWMPLSLAAAEGHETAVKLLLEKGVNPNSRDKKGRTPLSLAVLEGCEAVIKLLLEKGVDLNSKDIEGRTLLSLAAAEGHEAVAKLLLKKGADPNSKDNSGWTPLSLAVVGGREAVVKLLLERGADPNSENDSGWTPLSLAAMEGHKAVVKLLLEKGVDPNSKDKNGRTPLWLATGKGHERVVELLREKAVDLDSKDKEG